MLPGSARINVYYTPLVAASASGPAASAGGYTDALGNTVTDLGCYIDDVLNRTMGNTPSANSGFIATAVTPQNCALACTKSGYGYAGLEYGVECYCSATAPATSLKAALNTQCNMVRRQFPLDPPHLSDIILHDILVAVLYVWLSHRLVRVMPPTSVAAHHG